MSVDSAEKLHEDANELVLNDQFEKALNLYSSSLDKCEKQNTNLLLNNYVRRSEVNIKLKKYQDALNDAESAINLNQKDSRGFLKKGIALFNQKEYSNALNCLEEGLKVAEHESNVKRDLIAEWIGKCKEKLPHNETKTDNIIQPSATSAQPPIKHEMYQTESHVTVTVLVKNVTANDVNIKTTEDNLTITSNDQDNLKLNLNFNLYGKINPEQTQIRYLPTKVEIKLKKVEAVHWKKLEADPSQPKLANPPLYPTSSKKPKNWDAIVADVVAEEKDEKLEGDGALNKLFQQVYANGTDETRRAMNKSFLESGGTVLSTNWTDVGSKKLEVKPPDGMEWKKWD